MDKAVFFDRDGVINYRIVGEYVKHFSEFKFIPDFCELFQFFKEKGYKLFVVTNQQGIGKGVMTHIDLKILHLMMLEKLYFTTGYLFDDIMYCSDLKTVPNSKRKPSPAMILELAEKWNIDLTKSLMIGDSDSDILAGKRAGVKTVLLGTNPEIQEIPDFSFPNAYKAISYFSKNEF